MKLKIDFGKGGFKAFVSQHAEKAIFGLVLGLVAFFIYSSATQEVDDTGSPENLKKDAETASRSLFEQDYWDDIRQAREEKIGDTDYAARADIAREPIDEAAYRLSNTWDKREIPPAGKRGDPQMLPPEQVVASGGVFNVPMRTSSRDDPWVNDKDAVAKPKEETKPKRPKRKKKDRSRGENSEGSDADMLYMSSTSDSSYYQDAGEDEMGGSYPGMEGVSPESSGPSMSTGMAGGRRTISAEYRRRYIKGYQGSFAQAGRGVMGRSVAVVGVTALVPYEKQWEEYERALASSTGYNAKQDVPRYLFYLAERAEVPSDPNAPLDWKPVSNTDYARKLSARYAAFPKEIANPAYVIPNVLTMPIPPIMLKPYDQLALHEKIPRQQVRRIEPTRGKEAPDDEEPIELGTPDISKSVAGRPKTGAGALGGADMYGGADMSSAEGAGDTGYGGDYPSSSYGDEGSSAYNGYENEGASSEGESDYGSGDYGMSYGDGMQQQPVVKYKMVRFFDLTAEPGKSYRYRVAVILEDPNYPQNPSLTPSKRILDTAVAKRVSEVEAKDEEKRKQTGDATVRTFYIQTDWSEPSNIVTIAKPEKYIAGSATHGKIIPLFDNIKVQTTESHGKLVTMVWDKRRAVEVPAEKDVYRGTFLNFKQDADVLHPLTQQIKTIEQYDFNTDAFVADLRGGEELITDVEKVDKEEIETKYYTPGEFLVIDGTGNLIACDEIDDTEEYRRLMFVDDSQQAGMGSQGYGTPGMMGGGEEDFGDMESPDGEGLYNGYGDG